MYYSFKGLIVEVSKDYIVIEVNDIGYQVFISHHEQYQLNEVKKIYVINVVREDEQYLVGFSSLDEKKAFQLLTSVKGIGPKTAMNILSSTSTHALFEAITASNVSYLKKLPGIGQKVASQIILDVKGQLLTIPKEKKINKQYIEVRDALRALGFKKQQIDTTLASIDIQSNKKEDILKAALKKLGK